MISIIIPAEKNENYIDRALESVVDQTYADFEALILHSDTDALKRAVGQKFIEDARFRFIETPKDITAGAARNIGLEAVAGEYVYFLDSDDYISSDALQMLIENMDGHPVVRGRMRRTELDSSEIESAAEQRRTTIFHRNRYNLVRNHSALHFLIKKDLIDRLDLEFAEAEQTYSDLMFVIPMLEAVEVVPFVYEALYFRRRRNDPITHPSLRQMPIEQRMHDMFAIYNRLKQSRLSFEAETLLDTLLLNFYRKHLIVKFKNKDEIDVHFEGLQETIRKVNPSVLKTKDKVLQLDVRTIQSRSRRTFKRLSRVRDILRDAKRGFTKRNGRKEFIYKYSYMKKPLMDDLVIFESFQGKSYSDSPKYIYQQMLKSRSGYNHVWVLNKKQKLPGDPVTVKRFSLKYYYYMARAKYIVSNVRMPNSYIKREGQKYLQTWHGTPLKRLAGDMDDVHMPGTNAAKYKKNFSKETDKWDYLIAPNAYSSAIFKRAFWFTNTMLETGYPRNDILMTDDNPVIIQDIKEKLGLPKDKKVILYAPTWRDDEYYKVGKYKFSMQLDLERLKEKFGDEYIILLRMHYVVASKMNLTGLEGFAYDVSKYDDVSELYLASDMLITDYSSVFFDYANLRRPVLFFTYDIEKYGEQLRGFYIDMETELPGPLLMTNDAVVDAIENIGEIEEEYQERYDAFYDRFCSWDDGRASEKVVEAVFEE
ncbi:bifunctional glycosyltransferase/CDP-glycerol:glycerophosphate glycerophosphotransferase [Salinicoccus roseus]|uniref:bifunctional glycosyltransferase/CDP-glycerol:glycerophosphate glycerophosphotransferase n=1 Tax=Salinicoccus roseus TaxID=45670 RepID=UPI000F4F1A76|nr:CDP-glycerol:glycerophosphate glycerophosphotransferase [Salinicoccus roseus]RPE54713.1 CDP-glycerol glycerophosphotransferase [Salinicoccus roseus]GGA63278.1 glycerophosphate transferase [Salinicoccus roseus]